jgi:predicted cupin superfamily sugar epimerase
MNKDDLIRHLNLSEHIEGGYFSRTYQSPLRTPISDDAGAVRPLMSSIYYLLTDDRPVGHFHLNKSDILHFFQAGSPLLYLTISPDGVLEKFIVGTNVLKGQRPQLLVKGGYWKASVLLEGEFGLISETVSPGFDYEDMTIASSDVMRELYPDLWEEIADYVKSCHSARNDKIIISILS